jgi:hypothetical protein
VNARTGLLRVAQVILLAAVLYFIYRMLAPELSKLTWAELVRWRPAPGRLALSLVALLGVYLMHAWLWRMIITDLGIGRPDARTTVRVYFVASLGRYIPGKLWQLAGLAVLAGRAGLSPGGATAAALLGQFGFLATGLLFIAVVLPDWMTGGAPRVLGALLVAVAGSIWLLTATPAGHRSREWIVRRTGGKTGERLHAAFQLADRIRGRDAIRWGVGYGASWVLLGLAFSLFATAFVPDAITQTTRLAGTVAGAYLAGYLLLFAPAGLGVREFTMTALLGTVPGFPIGAAVVVAVLSRVWFTLGELLPLALVPLLPATPASAAPAASPRGGAQGS